MKLHAVLHTKNYKLIALYSYLKPKKGKDAADTHLLPEYFCYRHTGIQELLAPLVANAGHEGGWLTDQS